MTKTLTGSYDSMDKVRNALDDLVSSGIDRDKVFVDKEHQQIKVMIPASAEPEIVEILTRHGPREIR